VFSAPERDMVVALCYCSDDFLITRLASPLVYRVFGNATASTVGMERSGDVDWANQAVHETKGRWQSMEAC
jgi:hypothetical protein